ncbi:MAG TPA: tetratricopeptide repeat protein [Candidatus Goldiibacteriota bacterium]|nr:tetratricopeptide repeat protein [Candidatus Goldiibacteriota bacterium]
MPRLQKAFEFYGRDLAVNPYCPEVNNMYGALGGQLGNVDLAIKHLNTAIFTAPHYETAYTNLATAYMVKGDAPSAKKILQRYVEKNSVNPRVENMLKALGN